MNSKQKKALRTLFGETIADVIEAWCNITQEGETLQWMNDMLVDEISECWDGDISEYPDANYRDKLTLDRFFSSELFALPPSAEVPSHCPECNQPVVGENLTFSQAGEMQQALHCSACNWETLFTIASFATTITIPDAVAALDDWNDN